MKKYTTILLIIISASALFAGNLAIREFTVHTDDGRAILEWTSGIETSLRVYDIQRSFDGSHFNLVAHIEPSGDNHKYRYVDNDLFKSNISTYYYRISGLMNDNKRYYSETKKITVNSSGINRTWGSIKAMFR